MIERARSYVWDTARVLEQRRFEFLFGAGEAAPMLAALEPYRTADGGYGYALEPDGRGPTSQPPHIWTALEVLEEAGAVDPAICDHIETLAAPDGGMPTATKSLEPYSRAPWWPIGEQGGLLATALVYAPLAGFDHPWLARAEAFCWAAIEAIDRTHPYEVEAAITFLDVVGDRERARREAARLEGLVRDQDLVGTQPEGYSPGEIHHATDFAKRPDSLARNWFSDDEVEAGLDELTARQRDDGGWDITWAVWTPAIAIEWSGLMTIGALKTLRAYGRI
jgi:hypothetical protein